MEHNAFVPQELLDGLRDQLNVVMTRLEQHNKDAELAARITRMVKIGSGEEPIVVKRGKRSQESIDKGKATVARKKAAAAAVLSASKPA